MRPICPWNLIHFKVQHVCKHYITFDNVLGILFANSVRLETSLTYNLNALFFLPSNLKYYYQNTINELNRYLSILSLYNFHKHLDVSRIDGSRDIFWCRLSGTGDLGNNRTPEDCWSPADPSDCTTHVQSSSRLPRMSLLEWTSKMQLM